MDQIIEILERAAFHLDQHSQDSYQAIIRDDDEYLENLKNAIDSLTIVIDQFKEAQKEINKMFKDPELLAKKLAVCDEHAYHAEGEPVAHLVEEPAGGEALSDSSSSEEDDLHRGGISDLVLRNVEPSDSESESDPDESSDEQEPRVSAIIFNSQ